MTTLKGVINILATPFTADYALDMPSLKRLVNLQIELGVNGLTILGVLGEASKLSIEERQQVLETVMEVVNGRVPVIVGTSHPDLATCIQLSKTAIAGGATAVMIAPSGIDAPTDSKVIALYGHVAEALDAPIVVQDLPTVSGITLSPACLAELAERVAPARYIKFEDPPLMQKISAVLERTDHFACFGGLGGMFFLEELRRGAVGTMTGFAFTEILVGVYEAYVQGEIDVAERIFDHYLPLIRFENQPLINLAIRKELLFRRGVIANATPRRPFDAIDAATQTEIDWMFKRVGIADPTQPLPF